MVQSGFGVTLASGFGVMRRRVAQVMAVGAITVLMGCATTTSGDNPDEFKDPLEGFNRGVFEFNRVVDRAILKPISSGYRAIFPKVVRKGVSNVVDNLVEPLNFVNLVFQGRPGDAAESFSRFLINSTVGIGGIFDVASGSGLREFDEDFGQTLAVWGVGDGPYIVLPIFGPSTLRDGVGLGVDALGNPVRLGLNETNVDGLFLAQAGLVFLDTRSRIHTTLDALYAEKDPYVYARAAYRQQREYLICNGRCEEEQEEEDPFAFEDDATIEDQQLY